MVDTAPRDPIELQVIRAIEHHLGVEGLRTDSHFSAVGGDKQVAQQVADTLNDLFEVQLPPSTISVFNSVEFIATAYRPLVDPSWYDGIAEFSPIGRHAAGTPELDVFLCHGGAGDVVAAYNFAVRLPREWRTWGLYVPELYTRAPLTLSFSELSERHLASVRRVASGAPAVIGGFSLGALVAFEVGRRALAAGLRIPLLMLMDSDGEYSSVRGAHEPVAPSRELTLLDRLTRAGIFPPATALSHLRSWNEVTDALDRAAAAHTPESYEGCAALFTGARYGEQDSQAARRWWENHVAGDLICTPISGDHYTMFESPHVDAFVSSARELVRRTVSGA